MMRKIILLSFVILVFVNSFAHARSTYGDQYLEVTSPTNGDVWQIGTEQTVTWESAMISGQVEIRLDYRGSSRRIGWTNIEFGSYSFTVPNYFPERDDWHIVVTSYGGASDGGDIWDNSEAVTLTNTVQSDSDNEGNNLNSGLVAYYPFNGNANDESGNGNDGTVNGGAGFVQGVSGQAISLDGADDYVSVLDNGNLDGFSGLTISGWVKLDPNANGANAFVTKGSCHSNSHHFAYHSQVRPYDDPSFVFQAYESVGSNRIEVFSSDPITKDDWAFLTFTWVSSTSVRIYYNGVLQVEEVENVPSVMANVDGNLDIGRRLNNCTSNQAWFKGLIDEVRIHARALSESEIQDLYSQSGNVIANLEISVSAQPLTGNPPLTVNFSCAVDSGTPSYNYSWDFGDGSSSTLQTPSHTYSNQGSYIAQVTVTDGSGQTSTHALNIQANATVTQNNILLTNASPNTTITAGSDTTVYGSAGVNSITLESGAKAELINFPGNNTITIHSDSSLFTVSRSGASVTFQGSDGTVLKIPVSTDVQTIIFSDQTLTLSIYNNQVMLDDQEINLAGPIDINTDISDDHGDYPAYATLITLNSDETGIYSKSISANIHGDYDKDYFKIELETYGDLKVYTTGDSDTAGTVYCSNCYNSYNKHDYNSGSGYNFEINAAVDPGTHYISVSCDNSNFFGGQRGSYELHIEFTPIDLPVKGDAGKITKSSGYLPRILYDDEEVTFNLTTEYINANQGWPCKVTAQLKYKVYGISTRIGKANGTLGPSQTKLELSVVATPDNDWAIDNAKMYWQIDSYYDYPNITTPYTSESYETPYVDFEVIDAPEDVYNYTLIMADEPKGCWSSPGNGEEYQNSIMTVKKYRYKVSVNMGTSGGWPEFTGALVGSEMQFSVTRDEYNGSTTPGFTCMIVPTRTGTLNFRDGRIESDNFSQTTNFVDCGSDCNGNTITRSLSLYTVRNE